MGTFRSLLYRLTALMFLISQKEIGTYLCNEQKKCSRGVGCIRNGGPCCCTTDKEFARRNPMKFLLCVSALLLLLKCTGLVAISWFLVFLPVLLPIIAWVVLFILGLIFIK